jgi:hypothetical protein
VIPFIPASVPVVQGPAPRPPEDDLNGYPKRSVCVHCDDVIEQAADGAAWTRGNLLGGDSPECPDAPNPDDGPMPGHEPGTILHPPRR